MKSALRLQLATLIAALSAQLIFAAPKKPATIADLESRPVEIRTDIKAKADSARAMENYRRFLELQKTDPKLRAEALRRLGDLNLEAGELERIENELTRIDIQAAEAITLYSTLLAAYPDYPRNDQVLYQLARAYETTGQPDKALQTLDRVVSQYPQSPQIDEVQFRRGELLFSGKRYAEAQRAYEQVIAKGDVSSFFGQSLYKNGWSLFKQSLNENSLEVFDGVLQQKLLDEQRRLIKDDQLSRADRELITDTLRVMSITFSYFEEADYLQRFAAVASRAPYSHLLYTGVGNLYVEKERYQDAAAIYRDFVASSVNSDHAPGLSMQAIEAYKKGGFGELVLQGKNDYVERYNFAADYWKTRKREEYPQVVAELKINLKDVATHFHATAQKSKQTSDYQQAARWYRSYLQSFPDDADSVNTNFALAETLLESNQYLAAATEYERTAYAYPISEKSASAGYAALVAYKKAEEAAAVAEKAAVQAQATDSGIRFARSFPEHPDSAGVLTRAAEQIFAAKNYPRAIEVAQLMLQRKPPLDQAKQRIAWTIVAQSHFDTGAFALAEPAFIEARKLTQDDAEMSADLTERLAASVYKQAEQKQAAGDASGAVESFLRISQIAPGSKIQTTAQYDAAAALINLKQWQRAADVLEVFRRDNPRDPLLAEVSRKLAVIYTELGQAAPAALEFERIANNETEQAEIRREAFLQSADWYEKAGNSAKSAEVLEKYIAANPRPIAAAIEARQRLVEHATKNSNTPLQTRWYREIIQADAQAGNERTDRTRYLAGKAQLALAHPLRDVYKTVKLSVPLKNSLTVKRNALEAALGAYKLAATYQVAEVTTAATYEMAELYRTLARDLLGSERPAQLSTDELAQYDLLLEEQVFPFEEQAIEIHELNAARAREGVFDQSVRDSFKALAELKPGRYGKVELTQDVITQLN
jgi:cellulose synthase operon protein C